jgi:hypothetical protein
VGHFQKEVKVLPGRSAEKPLKSFWSGNLCLQIFRDGRKIVSKRINGDDHEATLREALREGMLSNESDEVYIMTGSEVNWLHAINESLDKG